MPIGEDVEDLQFGHQLVEVIGKQRTLVGVRVLDEEGIIAHFLVTSIASHPVCFPVGEGRTIFHSTSPNRTHKDHKQYYVYTGKKILLCIYIYINNKAYTGYL